MNPLYFLGALIIIATYWMGTLYAPFLLNIIVAFLLVTATSRINAFLERKFKYHFLAALTSTLLMGLLFFAPIAYLLSTAFIQVTAIDMDLVKSNALLVKQWIEVDMPSSLDFIRPTLLDFLKPENISIYASKGLNLITSFGAQSAGFLKDMFLVTIFYFFILIYGPTIGKFLKEVIPLYPQQTQKLYFQSSNTMSIVFYSIIVTAFFEGSLFAIIAYYYGFDPLLLGLLYGFASLIPVVGGALLWIPVSIHLLINGNPNAALVVAIYSIVVISVIADTFIKPVIIKYINVAFIKSKVPVNEILTFFAIFAGLSTFGFWGMIIGPAITSFFLSLLNLYKEMQPNKTVHPYCDLY